MAERGAKARNKPQEKIKANEKRRRSLTMTSDMLRERQV